MKFMITLFYLVECNFLQNFAFNYHNKFVYIIKKFKLNIFSLNHLDIKFLSKHNIIFLLKIDRQEKKY